MTDWQVDDEVTTTFGSIKLAQAQAYSLGKADKRREILQMLRAEQNDCHLAYEDGITYIIELIERELND